MTNEVGGGPGMMDDLDDFEILSDPRASRSAKSVYALMLANADSSNRCKYSFNELAGTLKLNRNTIIKAVNNLLELEYIGKIKQTADDGGHLGNLYIILK